MKEKRSECNIWYVTCCKELWRRSNLQPAQVHDGEIPKKKFCSSIYIDTRTVCMAPIYMISSISLYTRTYLYSIIYKWSCKKEIDGTEDASSSVIPNGCRPTKKWSSLPLPTDSGKSSCLLRKISMAFRWGCDGEGIHKLWCVCARMCRLFRFRFIDI